MQRRIRSAAAVRIRSCDRSPHLACSGVKCIAQIENFVELGERSVLYKVDRPTILAVLSPLCPMLSAGTMDREKWSTFGVWLPIDKGIAMMRVIRAVSWRVKSILMFFARNVVRMIAVFRWSRTVLNVVYLKLTPSQRSTFHQAFSKIFRDTYRSGSNGHWRVHFRGSSLLMPLTSDRFWLDWDSALSIIGHEVEIKETYGALLESSQAPNLFIDIGANYGTHSLLFLVQKIKSITFEPNSSCHDYFQTMCKLNGVEATLEPVALGSAGGYIELSYPERDTWLGSTDTTVAKNLALTYQLTTEKVEQRKLDDYFSTIEQHETLIKIDTEGTELSVLKGAARVLKEVRPKIIFECWGARERIDLFNFLSTYDYEIYHLPWKPGTIAESIEAREFGESLSTDFIAVPLASSLSSQHPRTSI